MNFNKNKAINLLGVCLFVSLWQLIVFIKHDPAIIDVTKIIKSLFLILVDKNFLTHLFATLKITMAGILIAIVFGSVCGILMHLNNIFKNLMNPLVELFRNIPSITLFPILLVIFGIGDLSRIFIIFWTAYPSILLQTTYGLENVDKNIIEAAEVSGANEKQIILNIKLPIALSNIMNGIKIGIGSGFIAIVVAEMLGASKGLGYMLLWSTNAFKYAETYAYIIVIGVVGVIINGLMNILIKLYEKGLYL